MDSLNAIVSQDRIEVPSFALDRFQNEVLKQLHLEFFFSKCRVLITPHYRFETTGESSAGEEALLRTILGERQELLSQLKLYLLYNLSLYSALLETNSYFIAANDHLLISRFVEFRSHPGFYEVKLYTLPREDLIAHYSDKIYLGRDFISLDSPRRDHFGLRHMVDSLSQQLPKLKARIEKHAPRKLAAALERELLKDLGEMLSELTQRSAAILGGFPPVISTRTLERAQLLDANSRFRDLKHLLSETDETLREMEERLLEEAPHAARYVTKLRKDVGNDVNYLMIKVNGRISDAVNGIRI
jgi:hypothetical protein